MTIVVLFAARERRSRLILKAVAQAALIGGVFGVAAFLLIDTNTAADLRGLVSDSALDDIVTVFDDSLPMSDLIPALVTNVVDGDTIDVEIDGDVYRIRYILVDTPETVHPTRGVERYGPEASAFNARLVLGKTVYLEKDVSETDQYNRLLRYVWLQDGLMVNALLVADGYGQIATFPPEVKYIDQFLALQKETRDDHRGLWGI